MCVFSSFFFSVNILAVDAVVTVEKPSPFLRRLFQAPCGNHQEDIAEGLLIRFPSGAAVSTSCAAIFQLASFNQETHFHVGLVVRVANLGASPTFYPCPELTGTPDATCALTRLATQFEEATPSTRSGMKTPGGHRAPPPT